MSEIVDEKASDCKDGITDQRGGHRIRRPHSRCVRVPYGETYPLSCTEARKRSIRRKAEKFVIREGELYFIKKKKKGRGGKKVNIAVVNDLRIGGYI